MYGRKYFASSARPFSLTRNGPHRQGLAQGEGARPRRRSPRGDEGALNAPRTIEPWRSNLGDRASPDPRNAILRSINLNALCSAVEHAPFSPGWSAGSCRCERAIRRRGRRGSHYCLSLSQGDAIRSVRLGRAGAAHWPRSPSSCSPGPPPSPFMSYSTTT